MGWRVDKQPDGRYAFFSEVVGDFTIVDMDREEAIREAVRELLPDMVKLVQEATAKVDRANDYPERWAQDCATRDLLHGPDRDEESPDRDEESDAG